MSNVYETFVAAGFSTFYEYLFANIFEPNYQIMDVFTVDVLFKALEIDSYPSTTAMIKTDEDDINQMASSKFCFLLTMYESVIGTESFRTKSNRLMQHLAFHSITIDQFYEHFFGDDEEELNWKEIFKTWIEHAGYPVINVEMNELSEDTYLLSQNSFVININETELDDSKAWLIPITFLRYDDLNDLRFILFTSKNLIINSSNLILFTPGYFRVNYDYNLWKKLANILNSVNYIKVPVLCRAKLVDDSLNLALAGKLSYEITFEILSYLAQETDPIPWKSALEGLQYLDMILSTDSTLYEKFKIFILKIVEPIFIMYGTNTNVIESLFDNELREISIYWMCKMSDTSCLKFTKFHFEMFQQDPYSIDLDLLFSVTCNAIRYSNIDTFNQLLELISIYQGDRKSLIKSLSCTEDLESFIRLATLFLENNYFTTRDKKILFTNAMKNYKYGVLFGYKVTDSSLLKISNSELNFVLNTMSKRIWNESYQKKFKDLLNSLRTSGRITQDRVDVFTKIGWNNLVWIENNRDVIWEWLSDNFREPTIATTPTEFISTSSTDAAESTTANKANLIKIKKICVSVVLVTTVLMTFESDYILNSY